MPLRHLIRLSAYLMTLLSIIVFFTVSSLVLAKFGINYDTGGGSAFEKIHPGTLLTLLAFGLRLAASPQPLRLFWHLVTAYRGLLIFIGVYCFTTVYTVLFLKIPFTPMVDTFLLPILFALLLQDLSERAMRLIAIIVGTLLAANALIALAEYVFNWRLVTFDLPDNVTADPARTDLVFDWRATLEAEWRATALLGHPLLNGMIISSFVLILASRGAKWIPESIRLPLLLLELLSMVTFGSRVSLVLTVLFTGLLALHRVAVFLLHREPLPRNVLIVLLLCVPALAIAGGILSEAGFFDRLVERFGSDAGSAATRTTMFEMFRPLNGYDLLFGPDQDLVATWQRLEGLEFGIESPWVGLPLSYGLIISILLLIGLISFSQAIVKMAGRGAWLVLLVFFITASTSASLSGKSPTFGMIIAMILIFLRKNTARQLPEN